MSEGVRVTAGGGIRLRVARQARGLSQQQLAGMAGVTRQALSAVEAGHSDPSLRVALSLARALGLSVEEVFGPADPPSEIEARPVAKLDGPGTRAALAPMGERFVALPLTGDAATRASFLPAGGLAGDQVARPGSVRPIGPPRPTLVVAGCDPALPLLETPLGLLDPPVCLAWWPCGSQEALRLAASGLVHAAGVHLAEYRGGYNTGNVLDGQGGEVIGFSAWREGLVLAPAAAGEVSGVAGLARAGLRIVNREEGSEARLLLDRELAKGGVDPAALPGYDTCARGHLQVASAIAAGLAEAGISTEPAALAYGLPFVPLADERFDLVIPGQAAESREVQCLIKALTSPWLIAQLASLPGYDPGRCGERVATFSGRRPG